MKRLLLIMTFIFLVACSAPPPPDPQPIATQDGEGPEALRPSPTARPTSTVRPTRTPPGATASPTAATETPTVTATTETPPTLVPAATDTPGAEIAPYPNAPACADIGVIHDSTVYHGLWDAAHGCHYDHEHAMAYPAWAFELWGDYTRFTNGQQISYRWQTFSEHGPENDVKHEGYSGHAQDVREYPCIPSLEHEYGISAYFVESHNLATPIEYTGRVHSFLGMAVICDPNDPSYMGLAIAGGHSDFGQLVAPYQGNIVMKPNTPQPPYDSPSPPYFTLDCLGDPPCFPLLRLMDGHTTWASNDQSTGDPKPNIVPHWFTFSFRQRDVFIYLWKPGVDEHGTPFFAYFCDDGNGGYSPVGCMNNGSTFGVHSAFINIQPGWDGLVGFDEDGEVNGFVTAHTFGDLQGNPNVECHEYNETCTPLILENVPVAAASVNLFRVDPDRFQAFDGEGVPEYDICFNTADQVLDCLEEGAIPSGWIGPAN